MTYQPVWSKPKPFTDDLIARFDEIYMESDIREPHVGRKAWLDKSNDTSDVFSVNAFARALSKFGFRKIESKLTWQEYNVLEENNVTIGEIAFILARGRGLSPDLTDLAIFFYLHPITPQYETLGWSFLLKKIKTQVWIERKQHLDFRDLLDAYQLFMSERMRFDDVARLQNAGLFDPKTCVTVTKAGLDEEMIRSLVSSV